MPSSPFPSLAPFACTQENSKGRLISEPSSASRPDYQRDRDRIMHSAAFRKLQYKTQVFVFHEGDYYRTRLTHSMEVARIARNLARTFSVNEDLAETIALAHDLGHTPFGHAGEEALAPCMTNYGGFSHNDQTIRILIRLEQRYAEHDGLNLTFEALEGLVKHNGAVDVTSPKWAGIGVLKLQEQLKQIGNPINLATQGTLEAQIAAIADDIAYNNHDLDDGLRAGLFGLDDLKSLPLIQDILEKITKAYPDLALSRLIPELIRHLLNEMMADLVIESGRRLAALAPQSPNDVRGHHEPMIALSEPMEGTLRSIRGFLHNRMYRHHRVNRMTGKGKIIVKDLFNAFLENPALLPEDWQIRVGARPNGGGITQDPDTLEGDVRLARTVCDYIAGMTDRYAATEHARLFDLYNAIK